MYADDTNITTSGRSLSQIIHSANTDLASVRDWLLANKLSINVAKTEQMFIGSDASLSKIQWQTQFFLDGIPITRVKSAKSIGVYIDERLSWVEHIDYLAKKVSSVIAGLRQVRPFISIETALTIYQSLILPLFDYCDVVWDNLSLTSLADGLQRLQNRAARVITREGYEVRSHDIRSRLGWNTLAERRSKHKATTMFKVLNGYAPPYMSELFSPITESIPYNLRGREQNITLPLPKRDYCKRSFQYCGPKTWNALPDSIKKRARVCVCVFCPLQKQDKKPP